MLHARVSVQHGGVLKFEKSAIFVNSILLLLSSSRICKILDMEFTTIFQNSENNKVKFNLDELDRFFLSISKKSV